MRERLTTPEKKRQYFIQLIPFFRHDCKRLLDDEILSGPHSRNGSTIFISRIMIMVICDSWLSIDLVSREKKRNNQKKKKQVFQNSRHLHFKPKMCQFTDHEEYILLEIQMMHFNYRTSSRFQNNIFFSQTPGHSLHIQNFGKKA